MNRTEKDLILHIEGIMWDPNTSDIEKTHLVQGLLYQWEQTCDYRSDMMFGDDDAHVNSPNIRRI